MKYFSLFTGVGGLDMGLAEAGHECVGFSEIKESSVEAYSRHYPAHRNFGDITKIDFESLPDFDILTGGFPCQAFSLAGLRQGFRDRRGQMIFYIYDLIKIKRPEFVVLENVKGLLQHDDGATYRNVFRMLMHAGYHVRVLLLNALNYSSAQARERLFFLCKRDGDFPLVRPVIIDATKTFRDVRDRNEAHFHFVNITERNRAKIEQEGSHPFRLIGGYDRVPTLLTSASSCAREQMVTQEEDGRFRYLTELEAERLQGFPEGWTEGLSRNNRWFAMGNAVNCDVSRYLFKSYLQEAWWN